MDDALVSAGSHRYSPKSIPKLMLTVLLDSFLGGFRQKFGGFTRVESHQKKGVPTQQHGHEFFFLLLLQELQNVMREPTEFYARFTFPTCANLTSCMLALFLEQLFFPWFSFKWVP